MPHIDNMQIIMVAIILFVGCVIYQFYKQNNDIDILKKKMKTFRTPKNVSGNRDDSGTDIMNKINKDEESMMDSYMDPSE